MGELPRFYSAANHAGDAGFILMPPADEADHLVSDQQQGRGKPEDGEKNSGIRNQHEEKPDENRQKVTNETISQE